MTDNIKLIKGDVYGNVDYFLSKDQCGVFYNINAGSVYCTLDKGGNSNKCIHTQTTNRRGVARRLLYCLSELINDLLNAFA